MAADPRERSHAAGCVVYWDDGAGARFLLIRDPYGRWTLPKGHLEGEESEREAAGREVAEETGVTGEVGAPVGEIRYAVTTKRGSYEKRVMFFLMRADTTALAPQTSEGISAAGWYPAPEALRMIGYDQVRDILARAVDMLGGA